MLGGERTILPVYLQTTLKSIIENLKSLEAFYAKADSLSNLKRDELEKEIEGLKVLLLEIKPDKMQQQQIFQIEEFRYTSGGCAGQLKNKINSKFVAK